MDVPTRLPRPIAQRFAQVALVTLLAVFAAVGLALSLLCYPLTAVLGYRANARGMYPQFRVVRWYMALVTVSGASCAVLLEYPKAVRYAAKRFD